MLTHLLDVSARSLLLALIAGGSLITLRRWRTAALEHGLWAVVVCAMLALFAFGSVLPSLPLLVLPSAAAGPAATERPPSPISITPMRSMGEGEMPVIIPSKPHRPVDWGTTALVAYAAIALAFLGRFLTGLFLARRLIAKSTPVQGFRESELVAVPCTVGCFRPEILLPLGWRQWDQAKLDTVLEHEGSHVRRHDGLVTALAVINRCVFWFHPLAWWLERRLGMLAEIACDDSCIAKMGNPRQYAQLLLQVTCLVERPLGRLREHALTMAAGSHLARRIELIRREGRTFSRGLSWTGWAAIGVCGLPVMFGAGTVQLQRQIPFLLPMPPVQRFTTPAPPPPADQRMLLAQAQPVAVAPKPTGRVEFEVASVRPAAVTRGVPGVPGRGGEAPPPPPPPGGPDCASVQRHIIDAGRIDLTCTSLKQLLFEAFAIPYGLLAAPDWTDTDAFDISAKLPDGATEDQFPEMFQSLLEDRFRLTFHRAAKEGAVSALVVAKGGLKVKPTAPDSAQPAWVSAAAAVKGPYIYGRGVRYLSADVFQSSSMGFVRRSDTGGPGGIIHYEAPSITLEGLAALVKFAGVGMDPAVGVVDMTGLKGRYQVNLDVSMADVVAAIVAGPHDPAYAQSAWLNMMQDGLKRIGLQLEKRKASVDVVVIDHLEKTPTAN